MTQAEKYMLYPRFKYWLDPNTFTHIFWSFKKVQLLYHVHKTVEHQSLYWHQRWPYLFHCKYQYKWVYPVIYLLLQLLKNIFVFTLYCLTQNLTISNLILFQALLRIISLVFSKALIFLRLKFIAYKTG